MEDKDIFEKEPQWEKDSELRQIRKNIRRRNRKTVSFSVVLAAFLLAVTVCGILPWAESLYWNPDETTYRDGTDLEITLQAYMELFTPGYYNAAGITYHRTGFASYDLEIPLSKARYRQRCRAFKRCLTILWIKAVMLMMKTVRNHDNRYEIMNFPKLH